MYQPAKFAALLGALSLVSLAPERAEAQALTTRRIVNGLAGPVGGAVPPGDIDRLFIIEQAGRIQIIKDGVKNPTPFLNITSTVNSTANERGLLGLAFHPDYANNGFFYVNYTGAGGATFVERYTVSAADPDLADASSGVVVIGPISQPQNNHNGGCIQFGLDGKLYIGMGDGGGSNDAGTGHAMGGNAQSPSTLLGKMLRLDVDLPFPHIPTDNPFVGTPSIPDEIWAFGVRNPWRFSFDRMTGDMYMADVGQNAFEEINIEPAGMGGLNYGWRCMEGDNCTGLSGCVCNSASLTDPVHEYSHVFTNCNSVTGGYVYRGCGIPGLQGTYFFADFCRNTIWSFEWNGTSIQNLTNRTSELTPNVGTINNVASFMEDGLGELYIIGGGEVFRIEPQGGFNDCNNNSRPDACDIAFGFSPDTNSNGIPDECECTPQPFAYCTGKFSSIFCLPNITSIGAPNASGTTPFEIHGDQFNSNKNAILFYGFGQNSSPFQGGTLCVQPPLKRTPVQNTGGNPPPQDCSGTLVYDMAALIGSGADPNLVAGTTANAQWWFRDPGASANTGLSNGLEFFICP